MNRSTLTEQNDIDIPIVTSQAFMILRMLSRTFNPYWQSSGKFLRPFFWKTHLDQMLHNMMKIIEKN